MLVGFTTGAIQKPSVSSSLCVHGHPAVDRCNVQSQLVVFCVAGVTTRAIQKPSVSSSLCVHCHPTVDHSDIITTCRILCRQVLQEELYRNLALAAACVFTVTLLLIAVM